MRELWPGGSGDDGGVIDIASDGDGGVTGSEVGRDFLDLCRTSVAHLESVVSGEARGHRSVTTLLQLQLVPLIINWSFPQNEEEIQLFGVALLAVRKPIQYTMLGCLRCQLV